MIHKIEGGRSKCLPYYPKQHGNKMVIGDFKITNLAAIDDNAWATTLLRVTHIATKKVLMPFVIYVVCLLDRNNDL